MQSAFVNITSYLQLYFTKLLGHSVFIQADSKLTGGSRNFQNRITNSFFLHEI